MEQKVNSLGSRIEEAIRLAGLTQVKLAKMLGISKKTLNLYVQDKRIPKADLLNQMVNILGCDAGRLLTGKEPVYTEELILPPTVNEDVAVHEKVSKKHQHYFDKLRNIILHKEEDIVRMLLQSLEITHEAVEMRLGRLNHRGAFQGDHVICMKCNKVFGGRSKEDCQCKHPDLPKPPKRSSGKKVKGKGKK
jgi:transcriptional regulator with XRE-family HTH domain